MNRVVFAAIFIFVTCSLSAQSKKVILINSKKINPHRYKDVTGDPYLLKEWRLGKIVNAESRIVDSVMVNYNGHTNSFEVRQEGEYIELESAFYPLVVVYEPDSNQVMFKRNYHKKLFNHYSRIIYNGKNIEVYESFSCRIDVRKSNLGGVADIQRFNRSKSYYISVDDELMLLKLNKKMLMKTLGNPEKLARYFKKKSLKTEADLVKALQYYEGNSQPVN